MALAARQRRPLSSDTASSSSSPSPYTKLDKPRRSDGGEEADKWLTWALPLLALGVLRYMSATSNIIHDCDEVFNYWEPLHFLLFKSGFQTWEYRSNHLFPSLYYMRIPSCFSLLMKADIQDRNAMSNQTRLPASLTNSVCLVGHFLGLA